MIIVISINNTNTRIGVNKGRELTHSFVIPTHKRETSENYLHILRGVFTKQQIPQSVDCIVIGSVVPSLDDVFRQFVTIYFAKEPLFATAGLKTGLDFRNDTPTELGADRLANLVASNASYPRPSIIVDAGTAITFDVLSKKSEFLGGAIVPGIGISYEALIAHAELLDEIPLVAPKTVIGTTTEDNIQSGVVFGFASLIDGMLTRMADEMGVRKPYVIGTGGSIQLIAPHTVMIDIVDPDLTLNGLALLWEMNPLR